MTQLGGFRGNVRDALTYRNVTLPPDSVPFHRYNLGRLMLDDRADCLTSAVMTSVPVWLNQGETITSISAISGATPANAPTNWWFALYSNAATPVLLGQTADQGAGVWSADVVKTLALQTPVVIKRQGIYRVGIMVKATTPPSLLGVVGAKPFLTDEPALALTSGSNLAATAPATLAGAAHQRAVPLVCVS